MAGVPLIVLFIASLASFQVIYGGRVIDSYDRRLTQTYMDEYLGDFVFDEYQAFHFYVDHEFDYTIPENIRTKDDFLCNSILLSIQTN